MLHFVNGNTHRVNPRPGRFSNFIRLRVSSLEDFWHVHTGKLDPDSMRARNDNLDIVKIERDGQVVWEAPIPQQT